MAVGSMPEKSLLNKLGLELNKWGYISIDDNYMTSKENIYAGGDISGSKATVAWAAKTGRDTAYKIIEKLKQ